jgi:hypothetical protein
MRISFLRSTIVALAFAALGFAGCSSDSTATHINALTGQLCIPNGTYLPLAHPNVNGQAGDGGAQCQGTGPGDNCDDLHSGKIDCIGDGNSGQGDDKKHPCEFPQPGCDDQGCCDGDIVETPPEDPPTTEPPPTEPPPTEPPPSEPPPPEPPTDPVP